MVDRCSRLGAVACPASKPTRTNSRMQCCAISVWVLRNRTRRNAPHSFNSIQFRGPRANICGSAYLRIPAGWSETVEDNRRRHVGALATYTVNVTVRRRDELGVGNTVSRGQLIDYGDLACFADARKGPHLVVTNSSHTVVYALRHYRHVPGGTPLPGRILLQILPGGGERVVEAIL